MALCLYALGSGFHPRAVSETIQLGAGPRQELWDWQLVKPSHVSYCFKYRKPVLPGGAGWMAEGSCAVGELHAEGPPLGRGPHPPG